jgi:hypothetical protein
LLGLAQPSALGMREEDCMNAARRARERERASQMIPRAGLAEKKQNHWVDAAALLATPPLAPALQKSPTADPDSPTHPSGSAAWHHTPLWALAGQS